MLEALPIFYSFAVVKGKRQVQKPAFLAAELGFEPRQYESES